MDETPRSVYQERIARSCMAPHDAAYLIEVSRARQKELMRLATDALDDECATSHVAE